MQNKSQQPIHERQADWQVIFILSGKQSSPLIPLLSGALSEEAAIECHLFEQQIIDYPGLFQSVQTHQPDFILLDVPSLQAVGQNITELCEWMRTLAMDGYRPVIVAFGGEDEQDRIAWLIQGADDVWADTLAVEELRIRVLTQLRRQVESSAHPITRIPGLQVTSRIMQRRINRSRLASDQSWALLSIGLDHFEDYESQYGHLASSQVLRSFAAMLIRSVILPDFIGQTENNDFIVLTHPDKATKIAALLCRQFEAAMPNFYSDKDRKQGYLTSQLDESACRRIPLMSISVGVVNSKVRDYPSFISAYQAALSMHDLAKQSPGNTWTIDTPQLSGEQVTISRADFPVLVVESDAAMAFLLQTTLQMDGYPVEAVSSAEEAREKLNNAIASGKPVRLVILDAILSGDQWHDTVTLSGLHLCHYIKETYPHTRVVCTSTLHQRETVLRAGADLYLPKPFDMRSLFIWVERLLR